MSAELADSAARLEANKVRVMMLNDGRSRIVIEADELFFGAIKMGAVSWTPEEMLRYVEMAENERHVFRGLKQQFKATTEFVEVPR